MEGWRDGGMEGWRDGNIDWVGTGYKVVVRNVRSIM